MSLFSKPDAKDIELANPPTDGISSLAWSSAADFLAVASWSNEVRIYEVGQNLSNQGKAVYAHEGPVLCVQWAKDGSKVVSGGTDNAARLFDAATGQAMQFGAHDAPIRCIEWIDQAGGIVATGSWDKARTLRYWDLRQPSPIAQIQLPDRCYAMDCNFPLLVVGTAERHIQIYNLNNPTVPFKSITSPLKMQTRAIGCFPDGQGFALSSVEGRVAIQYVDDAQSSQNFSFKTQREEIEGPYINTPWRKGQSQKVWSVNAMSFHPGGAFATAGSDGTMNIWDHYSRTRLKTFVSAGGHAVSYDWSQGFSGNSSSLPNKVMLHACQEDEVKRRPKK
ncbi:RNA export factor gle2 [Rhodosporidiobolus nylandii]